MSNKKIQYLKNNLINYNNIEKIRNFKKNYLIYIKLNKF